MIKGNRLPAARAAALKIGHLVAGDHVTYNRSEQLVKRNEVPVDAVVFAPGEHGVASELGAVVVDKSIQVCRTVRGSA